MYSVIQIGAGDVFRKRYIHASRMMPREYRITFKYILDIAEESELRRELATTGLEDFQYHRLKSGNPGEVLRKITQPELAALPVIIATPTPQHVSLALAVCETHRFVALEKPVACSVVDLTRFDSWVKLNSTDRLFTFGYYLIEKGLPLLALARAGDLDEIQLSLVEGVARNDWAQLRSKLGKVRRFQAMLIEGDDHRLWPLRPDTGGHTLETFSHLVAMALAWFSSLEIIEVILGRFKKLKSFQAESLTFAELSAPNNAEILLIAGKYLAPELQRRHVQIDFETGVVHMDLDQEVLVAETTAGEDFTASVVKIAKYAPQLIQLSAKLARPSFPIEYEINRESVRLSLEIRERGLKRGVEKYGSHELDESLFCAKFPLMRQ